MHELRWRLLWLLVAATFLLCLPLWLMFDLNAALGALVVVLLVYLDRHLHWLEQLQRWLKRPDADSIPIGSGVWEDVFSGLYQEARRQTTSKSQLTTALEHFQRAASALPDGMVLLNAYNQIEWCNPVAEQQLGLQSEQDAGQPIGYLVRQTQFTDYLNANDFREPIKLGSLRKPGVTLELQLVPFGEDQKLLLCRDISQLEKLENMRRDFIANVSHELRTPLTVVGGFLETLQDMDDAIPDGTRQYFKLMQEQTGRMRRLVEDLLLLSQLEGAQTNAPDSELDMAALLDMVLREAQGLSGGRHKIALHADTTLRLSGNPEELHSAFGNLVSNAIRYTPDGGEIGLAWGQRGEEAVFSVSDTGIGIEPQHLNRLTERFYRVDRSRSRATGGTGLGLSIVKHILTRHQARLEIESKPGKGSTFRAVFPAQRVVREKSAA